MSHSMTYDRKDDGTAVISLFNTVEGEKSLVNAITLDCNALPEANRLKGLAYGITKICAERTSDTVPSQEKLDEIQEVFDALMKGDWERERKAGSGPTVSIEIEALARIRKMTVKATQQLLRQYDKDQQKNILAHDKVTAMVTKMQKEAEKAPTDDLNFDDLMAAPADSESDSAAATK